MCDAMRRDKTVTLRTRGDCWPALPCACACAWRQNQDEMNDDDEEGTQGQMQGAGSRLC